MVSHVVKFKHAGLPDTVYKGRDGIGKCHGLSINGNEVGISLEPVNAAGDSGGCAIEVKRESIPEVIQKLILVHTKNDKKLALNLATAIQERFQSAVREVEEKERRTQSAIQQLASHSMIIKVSDLYEANRTFALAIHTLFPDFEYKSWSSLTIAELINRYTNKFQLDVFKPEEAPQARTFKIA